MHVFKVWAKDVGGMLEMVHPAGIEPTSLVPETNVLSVELRAHVRIIPYNREIIKQKRFAKRTLGVENLVKL